ncbi:MAG: hypothetical protein ACR652_04635 [Methylocystis sp.]|uniref:hypothetical protein n=1 Tax=Methylocystis sp. TaxID=1911079 RepID=UPI003DA63CB7
MTELGKRSQSEDPQIGIEKQRVRVLMRKADRAPDGAKLVEALKSDRVFWQSFERDVWNDSHLFILHLLSSGEDDEAEETTSRLKPLLDLINSKKKAFQLLAPEEQKQIFRHLRFSSLHQLSSVKFFEDVLYIGRLRANFASVSDIEAYVNGDDPFLDAVYADNFNLSHIFIACMLESADKDPDPSEREKKIDYICSLIANLSFMMTADPAEIGVFVSGFPKLSQLRPGEETGSVFKLLSKMFSITVADRNEARRNDKLNLLQQRLQPQLRTWVKQASKAEAEWIVKIQCARAPDLRVDEWADFRDSLITMLDGACDDGSDDGPEKIQICTNALALIKDRETSAPENVEQTLHPKTFGILDELGFFPKAPSRKRPASGTEPGEGSDPKKHHQ